MISAKELPSDGRRAAAVWWLMVGPRGWLHGVIQAKAGWVLESELDGELIGGLCAIRQKVGEGVSLGGVSRDMRQVSLAVETM